MQNRRSFLIKSSAALLGLFTPIISEAQNGFPFKMVEDLSNESWSNIRKLFPLNTERSFLNNGTMGPSPYHVVQAVHDAIDHINTSAVYGGGKAKAKLALSQLLNIKPSELALTHNVTEGINIAAWGIPLKKGEEVIVTDHEHVGNGLPWLHRARFSNAKVRVLRLQDTAEKTLEELKKLINSKTRIIAVPHVTCTTGQVLPVKQICELAKKKNIWSAIDGAHGVGMMPLDLKDLGCDVYSSCCHKWLLGPKGTGVLFVSEECQEKLKAVFVGGYSGLDWNVHREAPFISDTHTTAAHKYHYGTQDASRYYGINSAVEFHNSVGPKRVYNRILELQKYLQMKLGELNAPIEVLTPSEQVSRCGITTFRFKEITNKHLRTELNKAKIIVRYIAESELDALRISTHIYNQKSEIDRLIVELNRIVKS